MKKIALLGMAFFFAALPALAGQEAGERRAEKAAWERFHVSVRGGRISPSLPDAGFELFRQMGFDDSVLFSHSLPVLMNYPLAMPDKYWKVHFSVEISLTKSLAVGFEDMPIGVTEVDGYKSYSISQGGQQIPSGLLAFSRYEGRLSFFTLSYTIALDRESEKFNLKLGIGAGPSRAQVQYSVWGPEGIRSLTMKGLAAESFLELDYRFFRWLSVGITAAYISAPVSIPQMVLNGEIDYFDNMERRQEALTVDFPGQKVNFGGFCFGAALALHL